QPPDMIFYQGLALQALGELNAATTIFSKLVEYGHSHQDDDVEIDYFAVSLPDFLVFDVDLKQRHALHCLYMLALGYTGLGRTEEARRAYQSILTLEPHHAGAVRHMAML
ncbi:MAG: tetratricopeptide repeat protein, partial [Chloroflexota bacterium]